MSDFRHYGVVGRRTRRASIAIGALVAWFGLTACGATQGNVPVQSGAAPSSTPAATPSPTASPTAKPSPKATPRIIISAEDACVAHTLQTMTQKQMIGQIMLVGTPVDDPSGIDKIISEYDIGGVFLNGRSKESASTLRSAISKLQSYAPKNVRLLVSLDQEGGEVQSLQGSDFPPIPTAVDQGKESSAALKKQATAWAKRLADIGITLDLAPVSDTVPASIGTKNPPIGAFYREYGFTPSTVSAAIKTVVPAVQSTGVMTTLKHFPGLGRVLYNTDFSTKAVDNVATTHDPNLGPFIAGIKAGTGAVMISSAKYPKIDSKSIATFSEPIITGLLRNQLGFKGMIVSDAMGGAAAVSIVPVGQRAVDFIQAGGDFALTAQYQKAPAMIEGLIAEAKASKAFAAKIKVAAGYVMRAKYTAGLLGCSPSQA
ncbi:MAG TPA: glycoside hydrolase family 3 N-terminal domain-containing protein [Micromonosporaceae bacterium]